ncbi:hypothetical protein ACI8AF_03170 [Blastococcus sp. SYSU D00669]
MTADLDQVPVRERGEPLVAVPWALLRRPGRPVLLRAGVVQRLADAARLLPTSRRLMVVGGYRPTGVRATGGAVVVTLDDLRASADRALLADALSATGFVAHPGEGQLWSVGDSYWAAVTGAECARYGPVGAVGEPVPALVALGAT